MDTRNLTLSLASNQLQIYTASVNAGRRLFGFCGAIVRKFGLLAMTLVPIGACATELTFPAQIVRMPDATPIAVIVAMKSKGLLVLQFDTGAPQSIWFWDPNRSIDDALKVVASQSAGVGGDHNEMVAIQLSNDKASLVHNFRIWRLGPARRLIDGVIGLNILEGVRQLELDFGTRRFSLNSTRPDLKPSESGALIPFALREIEGRKRIMVSGRAPGELDYESFIFDTGVVGSDIMSFTSLAALHRAFPRNELAVFPGVEGPLICTKPTRSESRLVLSAHVSIERPYAMVCAFVNDSDSYPRLRVLGIRSVVENNGRITIDAERHFVMFGM